MQTVNSAAAGSAGHERFEARVGYNLKRAYAGVRGAMDHTLRDLGVTTPQWGVLRTLDLSPGLSNAELARRFEVTPQTMNGIVMHLESAGLIERLPQPGHGTVLQARLTASGRTVMQQCARRVDAVEAQMRARMSLEERGLLIELLSRCAEAVRGDGPPDAACNDL